MTAGLIIIMVIVYIAAVNRKWRFMFSGDRFLIKCMKTAGYDMYRKIHDLRGDCNGSVHNHRVYKMMVKKYGPADADWEWKNYQAIRYAWVLTGCLCICTVLCVWYAASDAQTTEITALNRPDYGSVPEYYSLQCEDSDGEIQNIELELQAVQYSEEEIRELFSRYKDILEQKVAGENVSLNQVCRKLDFAPEEGWEIIEVTWNSSDYNVILEDGTINFSAISSEKKDMVLYLILSYEEYQEMYDIPISVIKDETAYHESLQDYLKRMEEAGRTSSYLDLPEDYDGRKVTYRRQRELSGIGGMIIIIILAVIWKWQERYTRLKEFLENREKQMIIDYPDIISELLIYVRAGMPMRNAWNKMVHDYECQKEHTGRKRYALESMKDVLREMNQGYGESDAYVLFGKKCEIPQYIKLGNLLQQNTKKGSSVLIDLLKREQIEAQECRKRQIRSAGESAGSKLMMPMIALFMMVLLIIMVPAFMSFSMK